MIALKDNLNLKSLEITLSIAEKVKKKTKETFGKPNCKEKKKTRQLFNQLWCFSEEEIKGQFEAHEIKIPPINFYGFNSLINKNFSF